LFLRDLKLEKLLVLFGDGHNGKSVFFDIVNALLGEQNVSNLGLSSLSKIENRFPLASSLLNFGSEINDRCDADLLKKLASGEPVEARRLYKDTFIMRDYARLAFNANVLPRDTEHTTGFFRRFLIVPFTETISEDEKDPDLALKIIASELPGVFNWAMRGLRRLRETRKFSECLAATETLATYRKESDSVAMFLEDECLQSSGSERVGKDVLYSDYRNYCQGAGYRPLSKNNFGKRLLRQHQIHDSKSGKCRFWHLSRSDSDE
jgi:putative DNA primase/helicase